MKSNICILLIFCSIYYVSAEICAGCPSDIDPKEYAAHLSDVKDIVKQKNAMSNEEAKKDIVITKVSKQVVAGIKYKYEFTAKGVNSNKKYNCELIIVVRAWMEPKKEIIDYNCKEAEQHKVNKTKRSV